VRYTVAAGALARGARCGYETNSLCEGGSAKRLKKGHAFARGFALGHADARRRMRASLTDVSADHGVFDYGCLRANGGVHRQARGTSQRGDYLSHLCAHRGHRICAYGGFGRRASQRISVDRGCWRDAQFA